jgi:2-phospho-L-lactate guanylyltransferase
VTGRPPDERLDALVPLKRLDTAKSRLSARLSPAARSELMRALLDRTLREALRAVSVGRVVLVSSDEHSAAIAAAHGVDRFDDRGLPWNEALAAAMREAVRSDGVLILSADLPLVSAADVDALAAAAPRSGLAIARAHDAGTNALVMRPPAAVETCFGIQGSDGSAAGHARLAEAAGLEAVIVDLPGLALDLDSPDDVEELLRRGAPPELRTLV